MTKQYKINTAQLLSEGKTILDLIPFILFIICPIAIGLYNYQTPWIWSVLFIGFGSVGFQIVSDYFLRKKNRNTLLKDYSLTITDNTIIQKIPIPKSSLLNSQPIPKVKEIHFDNISSIKKTSNDFFIIENKISDLNLLLIDPQIENYNDLEKELEKIYPITKIGATETGLNEQIFKISEGGFKKFRNYFLSIMIAWVLIMVACLIFLIYPDTKNDWMILWTVLGGGLILLFWGFSKKLNEYKIRYTDYKFTIEEQLVIEEHKGFVSTIPINEISSITKSYEGIITITGNKGVNNKFGGTFITIPAEIADRDILEAKLSEIAPITKSRFLRKK